MLVYNNIIINTYFNILSDRALVAYNLFYISHCECL